MENPAALKAPRVRAYVQGQPVEARATGAEVSSVPYATGTSAFATHLDRAVPVPYAMQPRSLTIDEAAELRAMLRDPVDPSELQTAEIEEGDASMLRARVG